jgi:two-component system, cell cycle sensor histidine kinase and response regulator CckA
MRESIEHNPHGRERDNPTMTMIYAYDLTGKITFLNDEGERLSGYSCEEACQMNIAEVVAPEIAAHLKEQIGHSVTRRVGTVYEIEIITKDGRRIPMEVSTRVLFRAGEPVRIEGIAVPSVLQSNVPPLRLRCVDADFVLIG